MDECESFSLVSLLLLMSFIFCVIPPLFCCIYDYLAFQHINIHALFILITTFLSWQVPLMLERVRNCEAVWATLITLVIYIVSIILMFFAP